MHTLGLSTALRRVGMRPTRALEADVDRELQGLGIQSMMQILDSRREGTAP